jgi:hypothetical protein
VRGWFPDGLEVGSESAGRLSVGSDNRGGLTTVLNVTQQNVSIPRTSFSPAEELEASKL